MMTLYLDLDPVGPFMFNLLSDLAASVFLIGEWFSQRLGLQKNNDIRSEKDTIDIFRCFCKYKIVTNSVW